MKPLFKWVGGKTKLLPHILQFVPDDARHNAISNYFEPMMGGGALFFDWGATSAQRCYLGDINYPLMATYDALRTGFHEVRLRAMELQDLPYDELRKMFNHEKQLIPTRKPATLAALFILVTYLCFNGLYRENRKGGFNTPQGRDSKGRPYDVRFIDWERLEQGAQLLGHAVIESGSIFPWPERWPRPGLEDVVFYDPPYFGEFSDYDASRFGELQHRQLHQQAQEWAEAGATVIVCGSNNDWSWRIYGKPTTVIPVRRTVGASLRGDVTEALYVYGS